MIYLAIMALPVCLGRQDWLGILLNCVCLSWLLAVWVVKTDPCLVYIIFKILFLSYSSQLHLSCELGLWFYVQLYKECQLNHEWNELNEYNLLFIPFHKILTLPYIWLNWHLLTKPTTLSQPCSSQDDDGKQDPRKWYIKDTKLCDCWPRCFLHD